MRRTEFNQRFRPGEVISAGWFKTSSGQWTMVVWWRSGDGAAQATIRGEEAPRP